MDVKPTYRSQLGAEAPACQSTSRALSAPGGPANLHGAQLCGVPVDRWIILSMSTIQTWDPNTYAKNARFVSELGSPVLELLSPRPGERILDLGCGDGVRTKKLADLGCEVVGVDSSAPQVEAARRLGLEAHVINGEELPYLEEFDAVFSNAVLHWVKRADAMIEGVYRSLRSGGRFVAECGGHGCVNKIRIALVQALNRRSVDGESRVPWYFPTPGDYTTRLERAGFRVNSIALIPRPTPYPGTSLRTWRHSDRAFWPDYPARRGRIPGFG